MYHFKPGRVYFFLDFENPYLFTPGASSWNIYPCRTSFHFFTNNLNYWKHDNLFVFQEASKHLMFRKAPFCII